MKTAIFKEETMLQTALNLPLSILFGLATFFALYSNNGFGETRVPLTVDRLYVPSGYNTRDVVTVTSEGGFPSTCYKPADPMVVVSRDDFVVTIQEYANFASELCAQVIVPFVHLIEFGPLPAGDYSIVTNDGTLVESLVILDEF